MTAPGGNYLFIGNRTTSFNWKEARDVCRNNNAELSTVTAALGVVSPVLHKFTLQVGSDLHVWSGKCKEDGSTCGAWFISRSVADTFLPKTDINRSYKSHIVWCFVGKFLVPLSRIKLLVPFIMSSSRLTVSDALRRIIMLHTVNVLHRYVAYCQRTAPLCCMLSMYCTVMLHIVNVLHRYVACCQRTAPLCCILSMYCTVMLHVVNVLKRYVADDHYCRQHYT